MTPPSRAFLNRHRALVAVTALQAACGLFFLADVLSELPELRTHPIHPLLEFAVVAALWLGSVLGALEIRRILTQNRRMESRLRVASGAFLELLEDAFARWGLTASERDVALLAMKGLSIAEIAELRATRSGTVKAQCAAVYRKAGVRSRAQLLSHFVEDLMAGDVLDGTAATGFDQGPTGGVVASQHRAT
jgi:DNA-binding CsgD family transcriptional regulator